MKKFFTFIAVAAMAMAANAQNYECNNPVGEDGYYIVKYDCAQGKFAASNDFMADEPFVFAIDIKGTWLEDWVKGTPEVAGASRGIFCNFWTNYGDVDGDIRRFKQINGTVYGMTLCLSQAMVGPQAPYGVMTDSIVRVEGQIAGFEYTATDPGARWWQWAGNPVATTKSPTSPDIYMFATRPYEAGRGVEDFYANDFSESMFGFETKGYAAPCVSIAAGVEQTEVKAAKSAKFIENGQLYIISNGVKYNALGNSVK